MYSIYVGDLCGENLVFAEKSILFYNFSLEIYKSGDRVHAELDFGD